MKIKPEYGSHLPVLMKLIKMTNGPILEMGSGIFSTPFLHWACYLNKRELITYEDNPKYFMNNFNNDYHKFYLIDNWDKIDITKKWSIVFIDHRADRRAIDALRVANNADFIVLHDTYWKDDKHYGYKKIFPFFKYRYNCPIKPYTTIVSNFHDLSKFNIIEVNKGVELGK